LRLSLIIPTQRRLGPLKLALSSALAQEGVDLAVQIVVVDNDQLPSARQTVEALGAVTYVHEPRAGVAFARNAALAAATGEWIAFLDDDQEAPKGWLAALLSMQRLTLADAVFGPVKARAQVAPAPHRAYLETFFSRLDPSQGGLIDHYYGCGNSLVRRAAMPAEFSLERNHIGGEDDLLFGQMQQAGATFAWAPDAFVFEDPAPDRQQLSYAIRRAFAYGQGPSEHCAALNQPLGVARWMAIGAAQATVFGALAAAFWLVRAPARARTLDRAARGLGKLLWWGPFKIRFYGLPAS